MRLLLAGGNRASIVLLAALLAGCSNTIPGSRALLPGTPDATKSSHAARRRQGRRRSVRLCLQRFLQRRFRLLDRG